MNHVREANVRKTWFLLLGFFLVVIGLGYFFSYYFNSSYILYFAVIFSVLMSFISYWFSDKIILGMSRAKEIKEEENPELYQTLRNLCGAANLPLPKLYLIKEQQPNAFATGRDKNHAVVAVTEGLLQKLDKKETEGVMAHELSHVNNKDMLLQTMVVVLVGFIAILSRMFLWSNVFGGRRNNQAGNLAMVGLVAAILAPVAATLIKLAISRKREFLADATSVSFTHNPDGLIRALRKISSDRTPMKRVQEATAHLYIASPLRGGKLAKFFMTHPPIEDRIKALQQFGI